MCTLQFSSSSSSSTSTFLQNSINICCSSHLLLTATASTLLSPKSVSISSRKHTREGSAYLTSSTSNNTINEKLELSKWRTGVSFFPSFFAGTKDAESLKKELVEAIAPLDRGAAATPDDQQRVEEIARELEAINKVKEPLKSSLLNGKWELLYTTSRSILQNEYFSPRYGDQSTVALFRRPKILRPNGKIYQAINVDTLRAQNIETWPFFNQATANLIPLNAKRVAVKFDSFKIAALIPIKSRGSGRGQLEITYLDEELRISRGNQGNLFVLKMVDPTYRVPL